MATLNFDKNAAPKGDAGRVTMWRYLFVGLFSIGIIATAGAIFLMSTGRDSAPAWILTTAVVTGTIGLFSDSPVKAKAE
jgi:hypothetical protein